MSRRASQPPSLDGLFEPATPNGMGWPLGSLIVVDRHRLLYRPISKNACTSLKRLMISVSDIEHKEALLAGRIHTVLDEYATGAQLHDRERDDAQRILTDGDWYRFAVVRDPFSRLVSAYRDKFAVNRTVPANTAITSPVVAAVQGTDRPDLDRGISFAEFVGYVVDQEPLAHNPHWRPQALFLDGVTYDGLYRFENLEVLERDLAQRIGYPIEVEVRNASRAGRPRRSAGAFSIPAGRLRRAKSIDEASFADDDLTAAIADYFSADYAYCDGAVAA